MEFVNSESETPIKKTRNQSPDPYRSINQQLKSLELYKNLCEKRILEIYPDHPLPISESHLGQSNPYLSDLQKAKQKISKLEQQLFSNSSSPLEDFPDSIPLKYSQLIKEKLQLEESLRAEMLNNEEQRAYIEILKQALEESLSINRKKSDSVKTVSLESRRELANLKNLVKDLESQVERSRNLSKSKENEIKILFGEKENLEKQVQKLLNGLKESKEENLKLEEEKSALIDYVDEHSQKEIEMEAEMKELETLFQTMKENFEDSSKRAKEEEVKNKNCMNEIQTLTEELEKNIRLSREVQKNSAVFKEKLQNTEKELASVKEDKEKVDKKCESLLANIATLSETLKELQSESDSNSLLIEKLKKAVLEKEELIFQQKSEVISRTQELSSLKVINHSLEMENLSNIEEKSRFSKSFEQEAKKSLKIQESSLLLESQVKTLELELRQRVQEEKNLRSEVFKMSQCKAELENLKKESLELKFRENSQNELINELHVKNNEVASEVDKLFVEIQRLKGENCELNEKMKDFSRLVNENQFLLQMIEEEKKSMNYFKEVIAGDKNFLENKVKEHVENQSRLADELNFLQKQLKEQEKSFQIAKEQLNEASFKLENQEISSLSDKNKISSTFQVILSHFPFTEDTFSRFSSILSDSFQVLLKKLRNKASPDPNILCEFSEQAADQLKFLSEVNFSLQSEINSKNLEISRFQGENKELSSELSALQVHLTAYSGQIDSLLRENSILKSELVTPAVKNNDSRSFQSQTLKNFKRNSDYFENRSKVRNDQVEGYQNNEKEAKIENLSQELQVLERDRLDFQFQLLKIDGQHRGKDSALFHEVSQKLGLCERQILNYKKYLAGRVETPMRFRTRAIRDFDTPGKERF
jgi:chromosome segregation ATPase